jgi:hypothetical protein
LWQILEKFLKLAPHSYRTEDPAQNDEKPTWIPYAEGTWDDAAFLLKAEKPLREVTTRTTLPIPEGCPTTFVGKSSDEIIQDFNKDHEEMRDHRHLFSSHCFVVLDEQTVSDHNTANIWSDSSGEGWESRRCEFGALMYNLHPIESVVLGLHQLCAKYETLTVEMMQTERRNGRRARRDMGIDVAESEEED